jgi:tetratricopeptide (TPR) repeat protein
MLAEGQAAYERGEMKAAILAFEEAISAAPDFHPALLGIARTRLAMGDHAGASAAYQEVYQQTADPRYLASVGYCMNLQGDHAQAIQAYLRAIDGGYQNELVHNNLGYSHRNRGNLPAAREHFDAALRVNAHYRPALQNRAFLEWSWALRQKRSRIRETATSDIESVIGQAPGFGNLHYIAAYIWCLSEGPSRIERALDHVERAINLGINPARFEQGSVFEELRREERMQKLLQRRPPEALAADPPAILNPDTL